jgi:hypothetical protein
MLNKLSGLFRPRLNLPPRMSPSLDDSIRSKKQSMAMSSAGDIAVYSSWSDEITQRAFDLPKYTAFRDAATILLYISRQSIQDSNVLATVFGREFPWTWYASTFLDGPYPILRCVLSVPDHPSNPLFLESPLNIREGEVQAFCEAALRYELIDIMVAHETIGSDKLFGASYRCSKIGNAFRREVNRVSAELRPTATEEDFRKSIRMMEAKFPQPSAGLRDGSGVPLIYAGQPRNIVIKG